MKVNERIEKIIKYLLGENFQRIPEKAYIYVKDVKRYYAVGNVYHACMIKKRKLLNIFLLSHFKVSKDNKWFIDQVRDLLSQRQEDGFFEFDSELLKEKKNCYHLYSGGHMGLNENRKNKNWKKIESTYWILKILSNLNWDVKN
ncbi:hypothetical protein KHQ82_05490 [Mycoplasmatota bacterium]|nr:hypothetical protein KHQ82_05490 [Mycoplasmatota bacterium]